jgi:hypothetical protein
VARVDIPLIVIEAIDLDLYLEENIFLAKKLHISQPTAELFRDKRFDRQEEAFKPMPQDLMMKAGLELKVDSLLIYDGNVHYHEFPEKGMVPGNINFNNINLVLAPFELSKTPEEHSMSTAYISADGFINEKAPLFIKGQMMFSENYPIQVEAEMGEFDLELINPILEANAFARIRRGVVNEAKWHFTSDNDRAIGEMTVKYSKLNMRLLDERTLEPGGGRKRFLSFVINAIAVRSNNPRRIFNRLVTSRIYEPRDKGRFVFNYWWRATMSGLKGSVGLGQPKIPKEEEEIKPRD